MKKYIPLALFIFTIAPILFTRWYCIGCGKSNPDSVTVCAYCGSPQ